MPRLLNTRTTETTGWMSRLLGGKPRNGGLNRRTGMTHTHPALESLETRKMLTGNVSLGAGYLDINLTNDSDYVHVATDIQNPKISTDDLVRVTWQHDYVTSKFAFAYSQVN